MSQFTDTFDPLKASAQDIADQVAAAAADVAKAAREVATDAREVEEERNKLGLVLLVLAIAGVVAYLLKRKREQELDEALWEEPKAL